MKELKEELKGELREGLGRVRREIREVAEEQKKAMKLELEKIKEDLEKREERWKIERKEMKERIEKMERELEGLKVDITRSREGEGGKKRKKIEEGGKEEVEKGNWKE